MFSVLLSWLNKNQQHISAKMILGFTANCECVQSRVRGRQKQRQHNVRKSMKSYCHVKQVRALMVKCGEPPAASLKKRSKLLLSSFSALLQSNVGSVQIINVLNIAIKTFLLVDIRGISFVHITALWLVLVPCTLLPHHHHHHHHRRHHHW